MKTTSTVFSFQPGNLHTSFGEAGRQALNQPQPRHPSQTSQDHTASVPSARVHQPTKWNYYTQFHTVALHCCRLRCKCVLESFYLFMQKRVGQRLEETSSLVYVTPARAKVKRKDHIFKENAVHLNSRFLTFVIALDSVVHVVKYTELTSFFCCILFTIQHCCLNRYSTTTTVYIHIYLYIWLSIYSYQSTRFVCTRLWFHHTSRTNTSCCPA